MGLTACVRSNLMGKIASMRSKAYRQYLFKKKILSIEEFM